MAAPISDSSKNTLVVLAGGKGRIESALDLYSSGVGRALLIVGAGPKTSLAQLLRALPENELRKINPQRLAAIALDTESKNTIENAYIVQRYLLNSKEPTNILLLTSSYHMRRSLFILQHVLGSGVKISALTPVKENINGSNWYKSLLGIQLTIYEFSKLILAEWLIPRMGSI